jgi:hypothetical protein
LIDTDANTPDIQPECQVVDRTECERGTNGCPDTGYNETSLDECKLPSGGNIDPNNAKPDPNKYPNLPDHNPQLDQVPDSARSCWYLWYDNDPVLGCPNAPDHQRISALRPRNTVAPAGTRLAMKCLTCAKPAGQTCPPVTLKKP